MTQLDQLKQDLATLAERINKATEIADGKVHLTKEQLKKLISIVQEQTIEYVKDEIKDIDLDGDDYVELDLCGREIEITVDNHSLLQSINYNISGPDEATDSELDDLMNKVIEQDI
jgi:hypothetical protein